MLRIHPSMGDVSEGQEVTLVCSVEKGTLPVTFIWFHTKKEGSLTSKTSMEREESHKIANVRKEHQGGYYCVSTNQANEAKQSLPMTIRGGFSHHRTAVMMRYRSDYQSSVRGTHVFITRSFGHYELRSDPLISRQLLIQLISR